MTINTMQCAVCLEESPLSKLSVLHEAETKTEKKVAHQFHLACLYPIAYSPQLKEGTIPCPLCRERVADLNGIPFCVAFHDLCWAVGLSEPGCVEQILEKGKVPSDNLERAFRLAEQHKLTQAMKLILDKGDLPLHYLRRGLGIAAAQGWLDTVQTILDKDSFTSLDFIIPLENAWLHHQDAIAEFLSEKKRALEESNPSPTPPPKRQKFQSMTSSG